jgi:hypothetical protein
LLIFELLFVHIYFEVSLHNKLFLCRTRPSNIVQHQSGLTLSFDRKRCRTQIYNMWCKHPFKKDPNPHIRTMTSFRSNCNSISGWGTRCLKYEVEKSPTNYIFQPIFYPIKCLTFSVKSSSKIRLLIIFSNKISQGYVFKWRKFAQSGHPGDWLHSK